MSEKKWVQLLDMLEESYVKDVKYKVDDKIYVEGLDKINKFLCIIIDNPKKPLERHQFEVLIDYTPIILKEAFGLTYWETNKQTLIENCDIKHDKSVLLVVIKRQYGKTELMTRIASAAMIAFPNMEHQFKPNKWILCSHKGDHTKQNLKRIDTYLMQNKHLWDDDFYYKNPQSYLKLINKSNPNDVRQIIVYTGNVDGLGGQKFYIDEFSKWRQGRADVEFAPQLQVRTVMGIITTSIKDKNAWFQK